MAKRKRRGSDGVMRAVIDARPGPDVIVMIREIVALERDGAVFYTTARSNEFIRHTAFSEGVARDFVHKLRAALNALDRERGTPPGHRVDRVRLDQTAEGLAFSLFENGEEVCCGIVDPDALDAAQRFLTALQNKRKVVPMRKR